MLHFNIHSNSLLTSPDFWNEKIEDKLWKTNVDIEIILSDNKKLTIPKNYKWDGASIPKWLWWFFKPIDNGALGDLIHDFLYGIKIKEIERFNENIYQARKFADDERLKWRLKLATNKKIKTYTTHYILRLLGGLFYSKQIKIPK